MIGLKRNWPVCGAFFLLLMVNSRFGFAMDVEKFLKEFHQDPRSAMDRLPEVRDTRSGAVLRVVGQPSTDQQLKLDEVVLEKDRVRSALHTVWRGTRVSLPRRRFSEAMIKTSIEAGDEAEDLVDLPPERMVRKISRMSMKASVPKMPWSDSYWPLYLGVLGQRYADSEFPFSMNWKTNFDSTHGIHSADRRIAREGNSILGQLSPSEKYDLLIGARPGLGTLTDSMWGEGERYFRDNGKVETWMGICHGWAPASYMLPRPQRSVETLAADGVTPLVFRPSDIKGLASLLWAQGAAPSKFVGGRCNDKRPATDSNGRLMSPDCFDTNPGTWHMAIVNQIAGAKRSLVMDATYDYEVWNQPVISYEYSFFNPESGQTASRFEQAVIKRSDYRKDKFSKYRSSAAEKIVGVSMKVVYGAESDPTESATSSQQDDVTRMVEYVYDLELDFQDNVIGGEWYQNRHPDFLWTPAVSRIKSSSESAVNGKWNPRNELPASWKRAALSDAADGLPFSLVVESLLQASQ